MRITSKLASGSVERGEFCLKLGQATCSDDLTSIVCTGCTSSCQLFKAVHERSDFIVVNVEHLLFLGWTSSVVISHRVNHGQVMCFEVRVEGFQSLGHLAGEVWR